MHENRLTRIVCKSEAPFAFMEEQKALPITPIFYYRETSVESGDGLLIISRAAAHIEAGYVGREIMDSVHLLMTLQVFEQAAREVAKELKASS